MVRVIKNHKKKILQGRCMGIGFMGKVCGFKDRWGAMKDKERERGNVTNQTFPADDSEFKC